MKSRNSMSLKLGDKLEARASGWGLVALLILIVLVFIAFTASLEATRQPVELGSRRSILFNDLSKSLSGPGS